METWFSSLGTPNSAIFAISGIMLTAHFLGTKLFSLFNISRRHPITTNLLATILGLDALALLSYLFGLAGLYSSFVPETLICLIAFPHLAMIILRFEKKYLYTLLRKNWLFIILSTAIFAGMLGNALCPPAGWDELAYQIELPSRWLSDNGILFYPDNLYSAFPGAFSMLVMLAVKLGGNSAPRLLVLCLWGITVACIYAILKIRLTKNASALFAIASSISYAFFMCATNAYAEFFIAVQLLAVILLRINPNSEKNKNVFWIAGIFAGVAGAVKLTGLAVGSGILIFLSLSSLKKIGAIAKTAKFAITMMAIAGIFYLRPMLQTGNPFHPYFAKFASSERATLEASEFHHAIGSVKYGLDGIQAFFTTPILISLRENPFDGSFGYQFLIAIALAISAFISLRVGRPQSYDLKMLCFLLLFLYCFWFFSSRQARFFIPVAIVAILLAKYSAVQIKKRATLIAALSLALAFVSLPNKAFKHLFLSWKCVVGLIPKQDYIFSLTGDGYLQSMQFIRMQTSQNSKVLMLFENRGLYMPRKHEIGTPFYQHKYFTPPEDYNDTKKILSTLRQNNITHLLVGLSLSDPDRITHYLDKTVAMMEKLGDIRANGEIKTLFETNNYILFQITTTQIGNIEQLDSKINIH